MKSVMSDPLQRKKRELYSGPPCPHYPHKYKTETAHQGKLASRRRNHHRQMKSSLTYRLRALLRTIKQRCYDPRHATYKYYGGKGIKNFLTLKHLRIMWIRDGADKMMKPSVDRERSTDNYEFSKCCFRELRVNQQRGWENKKARSKAIQEGMKVNRRHRKPPEHERTA